MYLVLAFGSFVTLSLNSYLTHSWSYPQVFIQYFCGVCLRQCHYKFNTVFRKSCNVFCAKPKEVERIELNFSMTNKCFDTTQICN